MLLEKEKGYFRISPFEDIARREMIEFGNINAGINH